ncbi:MAG: hypothetical protein AB1801_27075, partial [Chloroflexota bacterium]
ETGLFGALFYFIALVAPWTALWFNRSRLKFSADLLVVSGVLAAVTIVGFFDYYTWLLGPGRLWQWLVWGLWGSIYQNCAGEIPGVSETPGVCTVKCWDGSKLQKVRLTLSE